MFFLLLSERPIKTRMHPENSCIFAQLGFEMSSKDLKLAWKDLEKPGRMFCVASEAPKSLVWILLCVFFFTPQFWPNNLLLFFLPLSKS